VKRSCSTLFLVLLTLLPLFGCISTKDKTDGKVHYTLGISYLREPNYSLALKEFMLAVKANPDDPNIHLSMGQTYQLMRAYDDAEKSYKKALRLSDASFAPICQNNLGALYLDMKRWDDAIFYFTLASKNLLFQNADVANAGIGYAHFNKGDILTAISFYKKSLESNPNYATARMRLAEAYEAFGKTDLALKEYQEVVKMAPNNPVVQFQYGLTLAKLGKKSQAVQAFREVIRIAPNSDEARLAVDHIKLLQ
jgi:Tfp pilus assembly protein PilF